METLNAIIESMNFGTTEGYLTMSLQLNYGNDSCQKFGGFCLYSPSSKKQFNATGLFLYRVLEVAGVDDIKDLIGKPIRVGKENGFYGGIVEIGHVVNDVWFNPKKEFEKLRQEQAEGDKDDKRTVD